jgi:predicted Fe-Mo cluster-binding NifX family protein
MKIAIACDGKDVSAHFGHCEGYAIYDATNSVIAYSETLQSPGHEPGRLPVFLAEHGVNLIIAGGMGARAVQIFNDNNIEVILGVTGPVDAAAQDFIAGKLKSTGSVCTHHDHECAGH